MKLRVVQAYPDDVQYRYRVEYQDKTFDNYKTIVDWKFLFWKKTHTERVYKEVWYTMYDPRFQGGEYDSKFCFKTQQEAEHFAEWKLAQRAERNRILNFKPVILKEYEDDYTF